MPRLRALHSSSVRARGEIFEASEVMARLLCSPDALGGQQAEYVDRQMQAEAEPPKPDPPAPAVEINVPIADEAPPKRRYMRRDLRAQE